MTGVHASSPSVYPRVGGGNWLKPKPTRTIWGLSPRGRGKPWFALNPVVAFGSIPAWAGETPPRRTRRGAISVYPRVGGGNSMSISECRYEPGLSPRGRGKPARRAVWIAPGRSIPAWAGETDAALRYAGRGAVYPRVGGGNTGKPNGWSRCRGLSPRGRGKLVLYRRRRQCLGSIPAWAGETRARVAADDAVEVYPRVGGGNRYLGYVLEPAHGLSPRGRGKRL